jgi:hypothetical protein
MAKESVTPPLLQLFEAHPEWGKEEVWMTQMSLTYREMINILFLSGDKPALVSVANLLLSTTSPSMRDFIEQTILQDVKPDGTAAKIFQPPLRKLLESGPSSERREALSVLVAIDSTPESLTLIKEELLDRDPLLRAKACTIAGSLGMQELLPNLKSMFRTDMAPFEVTACCAASQRLDPTVSCQTEIPK